MAGEVVMMKFDCEYASNVTVNIKSIDDFWKYVPIHLMAQCERETSPAGTANLPAECTHAKMKSLGARR